MNEYINQLKQALSSLPSEEVKDIIAQYEHRFVEGMAAGRSEQEIAKELGAPKSIAAKLIAKHHLSNFFAQRSIANFWRVLIGLTGLVFFNMFMLIPAVVYMSLLVSSYAVAIAFFIGGSALTASGLSGVNMVQFDQGNMHIVPHHRDSKNPASADINIVSETGDVVIKKGGNITVHDNHDGLVEIFASEANSDGLRVVYGVALSIGGILLFLLNLLVSKYTLIGLKHYARLNWSVLRYPLAGAA